MRRFLIGCSTALALALASGAGALPVCPKSGKRSDCVHDGDTWWNQGRKYRHAAVDAPELKCGSGIAARDRLAELMRDGFTVETDGRKGRYGRVLALVRLSDGREAGAVLVSEGLAVRYGAGRPACR